MKMILMGEESTFNLNLCSFIWSDACTNAHKNIINPQQWFSSTSFHFFKNYTIVFFQ
jgi:hypothetical protein